MKTLKDLDESSQDREPFSHHAHLRQEAIKWINAFNKGECHTDFAADGRNGQENICEWIENFFNITEEDLI